MGRESLTSFDKNNRVNLSVEKKSSAKLSGVYVFLRIYAKKKTFILISLNLVVVFVLEAKGLWCPLERGFR